MLIFGVIAQLVSCANIPQETKTAPDISPKNGNGVVRYMNFKPEVEEKWKEIAKYYTEQTGIKVEVTTVSNGDYFSSLCNSLDEENAPTLFHISNNMQLNSIKEYCRDLSKTPFYKEFKYKRLVMSEETGALAVPLVLEAYGIIYNEDILNEYIKLPNSVISDISEINNFETFKAVVEDMQKNRIILGLHGVFASTSFADGEAWRWSTHLFNMPLFYEYRDNKFYDSDNIAFSYNENFKKIFDLYIQNSPISKEYLNFKTVKDSMDEFASGRVAMVQNGNWSINQILESEDLNINVDSIKFMPIYIDVKNEEKQGLAIGTENYLAINKYTSLEDQEATIDFLTWLISTDEGKSFFIDDLGFMPYFYTFNESEIPKDSLNNSMINYLERDKYYNVAWDFNTIPSEHFKDVLTKNMLEYAQGRRAWDSLVNVVIKTWEEEKTGLPEYK